MPGKLPAGFSLCNEIFFLNSTCVFYGVHLSIYISGAYVFVSYIYHKEKMYILNNYRNIHILRIICIMISGLAELTGIV